MDTLYKKYVDNLNMACSLVKPQVVPGMTETQVIETIREGAERLFRIHQENDRILQEILFSKKAETLMPEEAAQLSELAEELFSYNRSPDTGVAYRIHKLLYEYAEHRQDVDLMIRELYHQGITILYLNVSSGDGKKGLFDDLIGKYFRAGASYLERYDELGDGQTRGYVVRCLGNMKHVVRSPEEDGGGKSKRELAESEWNNYMDCFARTMEVVNAPRYRQMNPEIPWDAYAYTMHYDRTKFLSHLRSGEGPSPMIAQGVLESAEYVYRHQEAAAKAKNRGLGGRTRYVYGAARYHAGLETAEDLVGTLFEMCESADLEDFSGDNIWVLMYTPEYLMHYTGELPEEKRRAAQGRLQAAMDKQQEFLFRMPRNEYALQVTRILQTTTGYMASHDKSSCQRILDYILACHPPTFVHSRVVGLLTRWFCDRLARVSPGLLAGTFGLDRVDGASGNRELLLELAYQSGLRHDLGKCMLLNYIGLYSRRLLDEEFACIRQHVVFGCQLLEMVGMEEMAMAAHYHHRSYDSAGGYPRSDEECPASVRCIVDIITVVDSLDAGTDDVGRSYAAAKTYERLVEELRAGKGTRYAPYVVELLDDPAFYEETKRFLAESRKQVYVEVYCGAS